MAANCRQKCGAYIDGRTRMVILKESLWLSIAEKKDIICDSCIEDLLGKKLEIEDLKENIPCNDDY